MSQAGVLVAAALLCSAGPAAADGGKCLATKKVSLAPASVVAELPDGALKDLSMVGTPNVAWIATSQAEGRFDVNVGQIPNERESLLLDLDQQKKDAAKEFGKVVFDYAAKTSDGIKLGFHTASGAGYVVQYVRTFDKVRWSCIAAATSKLGGECAAKACESLAAK